MSDYEGEDGWDPVDLNSHPPVPSVVTNGFIDFVQPRSNNVNKTRLSAVGGLTSSSNPVEALSPRRRLLPHNLKRQVQPAVTTSESITPQQDILSLPARKAIELKAYECYREHPDTPDTTYEMMHIWGRFCRCLNDSEQPDKIQAAVEKLAQICVVSEAFIEVPKVDSNKFKIWGTEEQVENAKSQLKVWEMHIKAPTGQNTSTGWLKQKAFDGRKEHRLEREALVKHQQDVFQQFTNDLYCQFEAYLIWPDGYDLDSFIAAYDSGVLETIRHTFTCRIAHETSGCRATKIAAQSEASLIAVYQRLLMLIKQMIAQKKRGIRTNQCRLPSTDMYRDRVAFIQLLNPGSSTGTAIMPTLQGTTLLKTDFKNWDQLCARNHRACRNTTKSALSSSIRALYISEKHVRMRVTFGDLSLSMYQKPPTGLDTYQIDDFVAMLEADSTRTEMAQLPLTVVNGEMKQLVDAVDEMEQFSEPDYAWAIHCDFRGSQSTNTLRLESEFESSSATGNEPERRAVRWLDFKSDMTQNVEDILEINMMEFGDRVGYQFHIGAVNLFKNDGVKQDLRSFEENMRYRPSSDGLRAIPKKRSIFPSGNTELRNVREITIARYNFKQTDGILEIRRIDTFPQQRGETSSIPARTEWRASYYYKEWDTLLSEFANINLGKDITWKRELATFFPRNVDPQFPKLLPQGFKNFMREVEEIQHLLFKAIH